MINVREYMRVIKLHKEGLNWLRANTPEDSIIILSEPENDCGFFRNIIGIREKEFNQIKDDIYYYMEEA